MILMDILIFVVLIIFRVTRVFSFSCCTGLNDFQWLCDFDILTGVLDIPLYFDGFAFLELRRFGWFEYTFLVSWRRLDDSRDYLIDL